MKKFNWSAVNMLAATVRCKDELYWLADQLMCVCVCVCVYTGMPSVQYLTVQYRMLALVPAVPYGTDNVPFIKQ